MTFRPQDDYLLLRHEQITSHGGLHLPEAHLREGGEYSTWRVMALGPSVSKERYPNLIEGAAVIITAGPTGGVGNDLHLVQQSRVIAVVEGAEAHELAS